MINKLSSKFKLLSLVSLVLALVILVQLLVPAAGADGNANSTPEGASKKPSLFSATTRAEVTGFQINGKDASPTYTTNNYGTTTNVTLNILFRVEQSSNARGSKLVVILPDVVPAKAPAGVDAQFYDYSKIAVQTASKEALKNYIDFDNMKFEKVDGKDAIIFPFWSDKDVSNIAISNLYVDIPFNTALYGYIIPDTNLGDFSVYTENTTKSAIKTLNLKSITEAVKSLSIPYINENGKKIDGREVIEADKRSRFNLNFSNARLDKWFFDEDPIKGLIKITITFPKEIEYDNPSLEQYFEVDKTDPKVDTYTYYLDGNDIFNQKPHPAPGVNWTSTGFNAGISRSIYAKVPTDKIDEITGGTNKFDIKLDASYYLYGDDTVKTISQVVGLIVVIPDGTEKGKMNDAEIIPLAQISTAFDTLYLSINTLDSLLGSTYSSVSNQAYSVQNIGTGPLKSFSYIWENDHLGGSHITGWSSYLGTTKINFKIYDIDDNLVLDQNYNNSSTANYWFKKIPNVKKIVATPLDESGTPVGLPADQKAFLSVWLTANANAKTDGSSDYSPKFTAIWEEYDEATSTYVEKSKTHSIPLYVKHIADAVAYRSTITHKNGNSPGEIMSLDFLTSYSHYGSTYGAPYTPVQYIILPEGLEWIPGQSVEVFIPSSITTVGTVDDSNIEKLSQQVNGKDVYKITPTMDTNAPIGAHPSSFNYNLNFKIKASQKPGTMTLSDMFISATENHNNVLAIDAKHKGYMGNHVFDNRVAKVDGMDLEYLHRSLDVKININATSLLLATADLKAGPIAPWEQNGAGKESIVNVDGTGDFRLVIENNGNVPVTEFTLYDILPNTTTNTDTGNKPLASEWIASVENITIEAYDGNGVSRAFNGKIQYATTTNPKIDAYGTFTGRTGDVPSWIDYTAAAKGDVKSFRFLMNSGEVISGGEKIVINIKLRSPETATSLDIDKKAYNSFVSLAKYEDGTKVAIGPDNQTLKLADTGTAIIKGTVFKANSAIAISSLPLANAKVELFLATDLTLAIDNVVSDVDGKYEFTNLPAADFVVKVTPPANLSPNIHLMTKGATSVFNANFQTDVIKLLSNNTTQNINAGFYRLGSATPSYVFSGTAVKNGAKTPTAILATGNTTGNITPVKADIPVEYMLISDGDRAYATNWDNPDVVVEFELKLSANDVTFMIKNTANTAYEELSGSPVSVENGVAIGAKILTNTSKVAGYKHIGWSTAQNATTPNFTSATVISSDITVYEVLEAIEYNLHYRLQGGTGAPAVSQVKFGTIITKPATNPTKTGYTFNKWTTDMLGATEWNFTTGTMPANDLLLYAQWTANDNTVTFNSQGGSTVGPQTVKTDALVSKPTNPTRSGYAFTKWTTDTGGITEWKFTTSKMPAANLTLYAQWTANDNTVTFDTQGGSTIANLTVKTNALVTKPANPTKAGYAFTKWTTDIAGVTEWIFTTGKMPATNLTLFAQWTANDNTVTFNSQDGSAVADQSVKTDALVTKPANPTRSGYAFTKWTTDTGGITEWKFTTSKMPAANLTLYAQWTANDNTVTFDTQGGSAVAPQNVKTNALVTKPANPTKTGYTFSKWTTDSEGITEWIFTTGKMPAANLTLFAQWTASDNTVTFNSQDGSAVADQSVKTDSLVTKPANPTKAGYAFTKWTTDIAGTTEWIFTTGKMPATNLTLYAQWTANDNTVTFDTQDGSAVADQSVKTDALVTKPANPTRSGYTFNKWTTDIAGVTEWNFATGKMPAANLTLYAQWTANDNTVTFNSQGGSTIANLTVKTDALVTKPANPTRSGYAFTKWTTDDVGTTEWIFNTSKMPATNLTLYAQWSLNSYKVDFNSQGGSAVTSLPKVDFGTKVSKPTEPTRGGFSFKEWTDASTGGTVWDFTTGTMPANDLVLYAQWTPSDNTVTFDTQDGSAVADQTVKTNALVTKPANPTKAGYAFTKWTTDIAGVTEWIFTTGKMPAANLTLYAQWTASDNIVTFNSQDGSAIADQSVKTNALVTKPANPTKAGYAFTKWTTDTGGATEWNFTTGKMPPEDLTLYAQWSLNSYKVDFNSQGGSAVTSLPKVDFGTKVSKPTEPTRGGFSFKEWTDASTGGTPWDFTLGTMPDNDLVLYAQWSANDNLVTFDTKGGSAIDPQNVKTNALVTKPATNPTKEGHTFKNWTADSAGITAWNFASDKVPANDITIYAQWTVNKYTLAYNAKGGAPTPTGGQTDFGTTIELPTEPTRSGYTFSKWTSDDAGLVEWNFTLGTMPAANLTLYAQWNADDNIVKFDTQGGSTIADQSVETDALVIKPATNPTKEGHTFSKWTSDKAGISVWNFASDKVPAGGTTIYAQWSINKYTLAYDAKGGAPTPSGGQTDFGTTIELPTEPTRSGYTFTNWTSDEAGTKVWNFTLGTMPASNLTLYAQWSLNSHKVDFNSQGGSAITSIDNAPFNSIIAKPTDPTMDGFRFKEWTDSPTGGTVWNFTTSKMPDNDLVLYAQWNANDNKVTFDTKGGSSVNPQNVKTNDLSTKPVTDPTKVGHTFVEWTSDSAGTTPWSFSTKITKDITIYAKWSVNKYALAFDAKGGAPAPATAQLTLVLKSLNQLILLNLDIPLVVGRLMMLEQKLGTLL